MTSAYRRLAACFPISRMIYFWLHATALIVTDGDGSGVGRSDLCRFNACFHRT